MSIKSRKSKHFSMEETCTLLDIWSDNNIQLKFLKCFKHDIVWEEISLIMINLGFNRSKQECCNRVNNLKRQYTKLRKTVASEQLDNNPYWLRFITVENNKLHVEQEFNNFGESNSAELIDEDELHTSELVGIQTENDQEATSATQLTHLVPLEEFKQSSVSSSPNPSFENDIFKNRTKINKRQYKEDDYVNQLLENDKLMLKNQWKRLKHDEEMSKATVSFFSAMTTYVKNCISTFESNQDFQMLDILPTSVMTDTKSIPQNFNLKTGNECYPDISDGNNDLSVESDLEEP